MFYVTNILRKQQVYLTNVLRKQRFLRQKNKYVKTHLRTNKYVKQTLRKKKKTQENNKQT